MATAGGNPEVGRVSIRVVPKVKGFRKKVERQLASLRDAEIDISPNTKGFREKVKAAARSASNEKVMFQSDFLGVALTRKARDAAKQASGQTVHFRTSFGNRFTNRIPGLHENLPGLKADLKDLRKYARGVTLDPLHRSALRAGNLLKDIGNSARKIASPAVRASRALKRVTGGYTIERKLLGWFSEVYSRTKEPVGKAFSKSVRAVGDAARVTGHDMYVAGQAGVKPFRDQMTKVQKQTVKARERLRQYNLELNNIRKYGREGINPVQDSAKGSIDWIDEEVKSLRKLSAARKAFNRNKVGRGYDPKLHLEYQKLAESAKKLRGADPIEAFDKAKGIAHRLRVMQHELGASGDSIEYVSAKMGALQNRHDKLRKSLKARDTYLRHPELEVLFSSMDKAEAATKKFRSSMKKVGDTSRKTFGRIKKDFDRSNLRNQLEYAGGSVIAFGRKMQEAKKKIGDGGITRIGRGMAPAIGRIRQFNQSLKDTGRTIGSVRLRQVTDSIRNVGAAARKTTASVNKMTSKKTTNRLSKFWKKFHQPGQRKFGLTPGAWMFGAVASLIAPLSGLIGGLLGSLPALGLAAAAALGATVLGWEGIKDAAQSAAPAVERAKGALSDTFRDRLTPQFETLGGVLDNIRPGLVNVANGLSDFSQGFVDSVSSDRGLGNMNELLDNTAGLFSDLKPFARDFTDGLLEMGAAGSRTFGHLSEGLNGFGADFKESMIQMSEDGTLEDAITSTYDIVGSLGTNLGKIMSAGMRELPNMTDSITGMFDGLGDGLSDLMPMLGSLSNGVFDVIGSLGTNLGKIGEALAPSFDGIMENLSRGLTGLLDGLGDIGAELGPVVGEIASGVTGALANLAEGIGEQLSTAAENLAEHAPGLEQNAKRVGDALSELFGGTGLGMSADGQGLELISESDAKALDAFSEKLADFAEDATEASSTFGTAMSDMKTAWADWWDTYGLGRSGGSEGPAETIDAEAQKMDEALQLYGGAVSRFFEYGFKSGDLEHIISSEIASVNTYGIELSEAIRNVAEETERASQATSIDFTPQIEALNRAETLEDVRRIQQEVQDLIGELDWEVGSPTIQISPSVQMSQDLGLTQFGTLQQQLLDSVRAMPPAEVQANMIIHPNWTFAEGTIGAGIADALGQISSRFEEQSAQMETSASAAGSNTKAAFNNAIAGTGEAVEVEFQMASQSIDTATAGIGDTISTNLAGAAQGARMGGAQIRDGVTSPLNGVSSTVGSIFSGIASAMTSNMSGASGAVTGEVSGMASGVIGSTGGMSGSVSGFFSSMHGVMISMIQSAASGVISAIGGMVSQAVSLIGQLPGQAQAALGNVGGILVASGRALVQGFINGITSMIGAVASAASSVVAAARDYFPFSPAKKGPFSGKGYTTHSGAALVKDFARGMESQKGAVADAAEAVTSAAQQRINAFSLDPAASMEAFHRDSILQPVLEANAKRLHDYREREAESAERLAERIKDINESDSKQADKEKRIADARESAAERSAEAKERMLESLETPEYRDIDRSIQSYYIDGMKKAMTRGLSESLEQADLAGRTREIALAAVSEARRVFGANPMFDLVENSVNAEHFSDTLQRVIEEAGIAEIPINFAVANLDQVKSDLGMGDGVVSRALDLAISTDPAATDSRYARQNPVEVHYHVEDMEEAIRLEKQRERKAMMKNK